MSQPPDVAECNPDNYVSLWIRGPWYDHIDDNGEVMKYPCPAEKQPHCKYQINNLITYFPYIIYSNEQVSSKYPSSKILYVPEDKVDDIMKELMNNNYEVKIK
jgi:hypothetical protein